MIRFKNGAAQVPAYIVTDTSMAIKAVIKLQRPTWVGFLEDTPF